LRSIVLQSSNNHLRWVAYLTASHLAKTIAGIDQRSRFEVKPVITNTA
jgi:hypothetical protein